MSDYYPTYEAVERASPTSDRPPDYDIKIVGAGNGSGKVATVYGRYGVDARQTAAIIVAALNHGHDMEQKLKQGGRSL